MLLRTAALLLVLVPLAACGGLSDQEATDLLATALRDLGEVSRPAPTDEEINCVASGMVDEVGPGIVDKYGLAEQSLDDVDLDEGDADAVAGVVIECTDAREEILTEIVEGMRTGLSEASGMPDLSDAQLENVRNCLEVSTDWSRLQRSISLELQGRTAEAEDMVDDASNHGREVGINCGAGAAVQLIRERTIDELQAAGATEAQAKCFQDNFDFDLYRQLALAELFEEADQAERVNTRIEAKTRSVMERCR